MTTVTDFTTEFLSDEDLDAYLGIALSNAARVTPAERKKLSGLMKHYAKMKHPFTACVRDNTKRFGRDRAERVCAVLKDLIRGTTKWRGEERKKHLSEATLNELFALDVDDAFVHYLSELEVDETGAPVEFSEDDSHQLLAELFFDGGDAVEEDGLIWKTVLREGVWKVSPGPGQRPVKKPIIVRPDGKSDPLSQVISMAEIAENFEAGIVEHVTVPLSHEDRVDENTGFVKAVKIEKDEGGKHILKAGIDFTEPEIKDKAKRGTIANISGGILFDYIHKETGNKFGAVMAHAALTNHPWLNGLKPFGVQASENLDVVAFSEVTETDSADAEGGEKMPTTDNETPEVTDEDTTTSVVTAEEAFGMSEEEVRARLERYAALEAELRENRIEGQIKKWQEEGKSPALLAEAKAILTVAGDTAPVVLLSEDGKDTPLAVSDIVERLVAAAPGVKLSEDQVTDQDQSGDKPETDTTDENDKADLSMSEKEEVVHLTLFEGMSEAEAIEKVRENRESA